jgi:hypothetical protein
MRMSEHCAEMAAARANRRINIWLETWNRVSTASCKICMGVCDTSGEGGGSVQRLSVGTTMRYPGEIPVTQTLDGGVVGREGFGDSSD